MLSYALAGLGWLASALVSRVTLGLPAVLLAAGYLYVTRHRSFWKDRGVPYLPFRFPFGNVGFEIFTQRWVDGEQEMYERTKRAGGYLGTLTLFGPGLSVSDPDLIKAIFVKDFDHFTTRQTRGIASKFGLFSQMMTNLSGQQWKDVRSISTPTFSTGKIKQMCGPCETNAETLAGQMFRESRERGEINIHEIVARYTMDNIASVAFGLNANSIRNADSVVAVKAAALTRRMTPLGFVLITLAMLLPSYISDRIGLENLAFGKEGTDYFIGVSRRAIRLREENSEQRRSDYLQLLLDTRRSGSQRRQLTDDEIIAQCVLFYFAGYDTTSNTITWAFRLLAFHPDVQQRLQAEIDGKLAAEEDSITFDVVNDMPYLDNVLSETLRLYPNARLSRCCTQPYRLPGTGVDLPRDCLVFFQPHAIHHDPDYYPDPLRFDPDRFLPEQKERRHPCVYLPFGHGPRNCIGMRFALLQAKLALVAVLRRYSLVTGSKSGGVQPVLQKNPGPLKEQGGTWLKVQKRA